MRLSWISAICLAAWTFAGCSQSLPPRDSVETLSLDQLNEAQQDQREIALAARDALFQELLAELTEALSSSGPASAIEVCSQKAPQIAADVSQQFGVRIGRTSHRLRNPENVPPEWAEPLVDAQVAEPQLIALTEGRLGTLLPIRLKAQCLMCHGPKAQILPDVQQALDRAYPKDQATGFQEGDLRGWFWVSVPKDAQMPAADESEQPDDAAAVDTADQT
jgi:hypothetical protein